jgi:hypothetical protein
MTVVILEDAAEDIEAGRHFYESREAGIGEYFVESIHVKQSMPKLRLPIWLA